MQIATFFVHDVYNIKGVGIVIAGEVKSGTISVGNTVNIRGKIATVKSIEEFHQRLPQAVTGQKIGIALEGIEKNDVKSQDTLSFENP